MDYINFKCSAESRYVKCHFGKCRGAILINIPFKKEDVKLDKGQLKRYLIWRYVIASTDHFASQTFWQFCIV
jgi:hypothetical protein